MIESIFLHVGSTCALKCCHKLVTSYPGCLSPPTWPGYEARDSHSGSLWFGVTVAATGVTRARANRSAHFNIHFIYSWHVSSFMDYLHVVKIAKLSGYKTERKNLLVLCLRTRLQSIIK